MSLHRLGVAKIAFYQSLQSSLLEGIHSEKRIAFNLNNRLLKVQGREIEFVF